MTTKTYSNKVGLSILTALFFFMGFITVLNDILVPHLKQIFDLNYFQAALIQFTFFGAYFIAGNFFGWVVDKIGYHKGVVGGFLLTALGCILFYPAAETGSYPIFLLALFILACGVVFLQTTGNPYVTLLAPGKEANALTLVQAFNSLGTTLGPIFGSFLILTATAEYASKLDEAKSVQTPYLMIAGVLIILGIVIKLLKLPDPKEASQQYSHSHHDTRTSIWQYKHLILGAGAIFFYVGAEVSIGTFLINTMKEIAGIVESDGAKYIAYYWGGAMVGRFLGSALMLKIAPNRYLAFNALANIVLVMIGVFAGGWVSLGALLIVGFFNSIMFPTIFSLATAKLGGLTAKASGLISMAIVGGALVPPIQGFLADNSNLLFSYIVPALCYFYILFFAIKGYRAS